MAVYVVLLKEYEDDENINLAAQRIARIVGREKGILPERTTIES